MRTLRLLPSLFILLFFTIGYATTDNATAKRNDADSVTGETGQASSNESQSEGTSDQTTPSDKVFSETIAGKYRDIWIRGFELLMSKLPEDVENTPYQSLAVLDQFLNNSVYWAGIDGFTYYALESATNVLGWMSIIPVDHPSYDQGFTSIGLDANEQLNMLRIAAIEVNEIWAGVFLVHELMHLYDRGTGFEPMVNPTREQFILGELRAYHFELMAVNMYTVYRFQEEMDLLLEKYQPQNAEELRNFIYHLDREEYRRIDTVLTTAAPQSEAEAALRGGFYALAFILRGAQKLEMETNEVMAIIDDIYS